MGSSWKRSDVLGMCVSATRSRFHALGDLIASSSSFSSAVSRVYMAYAPDAAACHGIDDAEYEKDCGDREHGAEDA